MEGHSNGAAHQGTVIAIRGSVVDAHFPQPLPALYHVLRAGDRQHIVIEVIAHLDADTVRGIALTSTRGLALGSAIMDTGQPLQVPVGRRVLGRVFDVFGATIDGQGTVDRRRMAVDSSPACAPRAASHDGRGL